MTDNVKQVSREFVYTQEDFHYIKKIVYAECGINLSNAKQDMVYSRLARRIRILKLSKFAEYCKYLSENPDKELDHAINAITTNLTHFFRENHHFELLKSTIIPELVKRQPRGKRIRIWSAGCSTGEEPYSIAMTLKECLPNYASWDIKILATDLDTNVLETCKAGVYAEKRIEPVDEHNTKRWFRKDPSSPAKVIIAPELRENITFKQLNLINDWPFAGPFDVIFCRNVVIYFDKETQQKLFNRYYDLLAPEGHLFLGHSEQLGDLQERFTLLGKTAFRKI